jgi:hypothetical protein
MPIATTVPIAASVIAPSTITAICDFFRRLSTDDIGGGNDGGDIGANGNASSSALPTALIKFFFFFENKNASDNIVDNRNENNHALCNTLETFFFLK